MKKGIRKRSLIVLVSLTLMYLLPPLSAIADQSWEYDPANGASFSMGIYSSRWITIQSGTTGKSCTVCEESTGCINASQLLDIPIETINATIGQLVASDATGTKVLVTENDFDVCSQVIYPWNQ